MPGFGRCYQLQKLGKCGGIYYAVYSYFDDGDLSHQGPSLALFAPHYLSHSDLRDILRQMTAFYREKYPGDFR
jgi:hypothetical protein